MTDPACPSCGVPYVDHMGPHGTCAALQDAMVRERAEVAARRDCAERAGIQDPDDSAACLDDFVDEILLLRAAIDSALCMLCEGPDAIGGREAREQAIAILSAAVRSA